MNTKNKSRLVAALGVFLAMKTFAADFEFRLQSVNDEDPKKPWGEFTLVNTSAVPLKVFGVGDSTPTPRKPAFVQFQYRPRTAWKGAGAAGYGDAAATLVTLAPGEKRTLQIPLWNIAHLAATGRVGLRAADAEKRIWSDPIEPQAFAGRLTQASPAK